MLREPASKRIQVIPSNDELDVKGGKELQYLLGYWLGRHRCPANEKQLL